jgi:hypothetical protein
MSNLLKKSIDTFRTAPVGTGRVILGTSGLAVEAELLAHNPNIYEALPAPLILASIAIGGLKAASKNRLRDRLEASIERQGYNDRVFAKTLGTWCSRQTARVVCKEYGYLEDYEKLCEQADDLDYKWIPHIP